MVDLRLELEPPGVPEDCREPDRGYAASTIPTGSGANERKKGAAPQPRTAHAAGGCACVETRRACTFGGQVLILRLRPSKRDKGNEKPAGRAYLGRHEESPVT
jgi:hypothetical protein